MVQWWQLTLCEFLCVCNIHTRTKFCKWHECYLSIVLSFVSHFLCSINTEGHKYLFQEFTLVINLISHLPLYSSTPSILVSLSFLNIGKTEGNTSILQTLLLEAIVLKNKQKRFISILKNCFLNGTQKHCPLSWDRKEGTRVFLPVNDT